VLGDKPTTAYLTHHFLNSTNGADSASTSIVGPDLSADYHTFAIDWRPTSITWYVDGVQKYQVTKNIPAGKMYILANLAVGGWAGAPDSTTKFPGYMQIDYIRAYPFKG
jgi:beta-glucanase (GH16 family)